MCNKVLLLVVLFGVLWTKAASLLSMPFLTLFLCKSTHLPIAIIGIIVGLQPLALCFGSVFGGYLSDVFKRQTIMLLSILIGSAVFLGFYLTGKFLAGNLSAIMFGALNLLNGFSSALFSPTSRALISDISTSAQDNIKYLHFRYLALNMGAVIGPLAGVYTGIAVNLNAFLVTGFLYMAYGIVLFTIIKKSINAPEKAKCSDSLPYEFFSAIKYLGTNYLFLSLLFSLILFNLVYIQLTSNYTLIINKSIVNGTVFYSWLLSLNAALVVIFQPIIYKVVKHKNQQLLIFYGYLILFSCCLILIFTSINKTSLVLFVISLSIAEILIFPTGSILISSFTIEKYRGTAFGAIDLEYLGCAVGPLIGSYILQIYDLTGYLYLMAIISLASIFIYYPCLINKNKIQVV